MVLESYLGGFSGHLYAGLEDGDGEAGMGRAAQPQSEVWVRGLDLRGERGEGRGERGEGRGERGEGEGGKVIAYRATIYVTPYTC